MFGKKVVPRLSLILLTATVYLPTLRAGFIWDDNAYVTHNQQIRTVDGLRIIWFQPGGVPHVQYYPLTLSTFWLEYHLWELRPVGYHLVNVLLHGLNAVLLVGVLWRLAVPGAWLAAAVFALHPVQVESVAWITERKNVLSGLFYLLSLGAALRVFLPEASPSRQQGRWGWYLLTVLFLICALLSKTVTCSLPAVLVLLIWWKRGWLTRQDWVLLAPLFALGLCLSLLTVWMEKSVLNAAGEDFQFSALARCLIAGRALWFYAGKLAWPTDLSYIYPRWHIDSSAIWQYAFPLGVLAVGVGLWAARGRLGRGPLVACCFFAGTLVPALGFVDVYPMRFSFVADHFQYLASIGLIALAAALTCHLGEWRRWLAPALGGLFLVILGVLTWRQARIYVDLETVFTDTLTKNPDCWLAHNYLSMVEFAKGNKEKAVQHGLKGIELNPHEAPAHYNLGIVFASQGKLPEAQEQYTLAAKYDTSHADAWMNLGIVLAQQGMMAEAVAPLAQAVRLDPTHRERFFNRAQVLFRLAKLDEAATDLADALRIDPRYAEAHDLLGEVLTDQGQQARALKSFRQAVEINPGLAQFHFNLGLAYQRLGEPSAARAEFTKGMKGDPRWPKAAIQTAWTLATHRDARARDGSLALQLAEEACREVGYANPAFPDTLAAAHAELGRFEEAATILRQGLAMPAVAQDSRLEKALQSRLASYESHHAYRAGR